MRQGREVKSCVFTRHTTTLRVALACANSMLTTAGSADSSSGLVNKRHAYTSLAAALDHLQGQNTAVAGYTAQVTTVTTTTSGALDSYATPATASYRPMTSRMVSDKSNGGETVTSKQQQAAASGDRDSSHLIHKRVLTSTTDHALVQGKHRQRDLGPNKLHVHIHHFQHRLRQQAVERRHEAVSSRAMTPSSVR